MPSPIIAVFGASAARPGDGSYEDGVRCGRLLAKAGFGVVTGGYAGLMEAVSKGAHEGGGHVVGVTVPDLFPDRSGANGYVAEEVKTSSLAERIDHLTDLSAGSIVLPGSIGTLAELGVAWNLAFVARYSGSIPKPVVTVGESWSRIVADLIGVLETDPRLVMPVQTVEQAVAVIADRVPLDA